MANPSLPSFVELMASLGLQDEHAANALLRGAAPPDPGTTPPLPLVNTPDSSTYRQSIASLDSTPTPLSTASSLVTPLSSPPVQRERPTSHGKKRYSPYGLSTLSGDIYARRGSVPDVASQALHGQDRRLHHLSAPEPFHDHHSNYSTGRVTDEDGDEQMEDASARNLPLPVVATGHSYKSPTLHCAGQPNLLISRQRIPRSAHAQPSMPRTKSHSHMRATTTNGASHKHSPQPQNQRPSPRVDMPMTDAERANVNDAEGDIAVVSISSLLRRSHPNPTSSRPTATGPTNQPTVSILDSQRGFQFPSVSPLLPLTDPTSSATATTNPSNNISGNPSDLQSPPQQPHRPPPSAPHTKTSFSFLPGASLSGTNATSLSAARRARHARSSSARSVREMIRERESNVLLAPLHSFHPMGETEEENEGANNHYDERRPTPAESRARHKSTGQESMASTSSTDPGTTSIPVPASISSSSLPLPPGSALSSFLPLDDASRSFSHRRRAKRHTAEGTTARTGGKRSSPPPPLTLPTLPINFNLRALVVAGAGGERDGSGSERDRLGASEGYVSRREPHSPDPRGSWRRRAAPLEVAGM